MIIQLSKKFSTSITLLAIVLASSCSKKVQPPKEEAPVKVALHKGYTEAMVRYFKRDGCDFALQLMDGSHLEPDKVPVKFQKDSLKVLVRYQVRTDVESICMMGKMVKIIEIKKK